LIPPAPEQKFLNTFGNIGVAPETIETRASGGAAHSLLQFTVNRFARTRNLDRTKAKSRSGDNRAAFMQTILARGGQPRPCPGDLF